MSTIGTGRPNEWESLGDHERRIKAIEATPAGAATPWVEFTEPFDNDWVNAGAPYLDAAYRRNNGNLELRGSISGGVSGTSPFSVPAGFAPEATVVTAAALTDAGDLAITVVDDAGVVTIFLFGGGGYSPGGTDVAVADGGTGASTASDARTNLGLAIGTNIEAHDADLTTIAGLSPSNDDVLQRKSGAWTNRTIAQLLTDLAAAGTTFQPLDSDLTALAGLAIVADTLPYGSGSHTMALATFTSFARSLLDDVDADAARATLDVIAANIPFTPAGTISATDVQAAIEEVAAEAGSSGTVVVARATNSGAQSVSAGTPAFLTFNTEEYDTASIHSTAGGSNTKLTAPQDGYYLVFFAADLLRTSGTPTSAYAALYRNGSLPGGGSTGEDVQPLTNTVTSSRFLSEVQLLNATDYVEVEIGVSGTGAVDVSNQFFGMYLLQEGAASPPDAADIPFTPAGTISATDVQAAIEEVATEAGAGSTADVQTFTAGTGQTWNKPAGSPQTVEVIVVGPGGGGGGGPSSVNTARGGGCGGGAASAKRATFLASDLPTSVTVDVGTGGGAGTGGASGAGTVGGNGSDGSGPTSFGTFLSAFAGGGGRGGTTASVSGGAGASMAASASAITGGSPRTSSGGIAGQGTDVSGGAAGTSAEWGGASGGGSSTSTPHAGGSSVFGGAGGGSGGCVNASNVGGSGSDGGTSNAYTAGGGAGGGGGGSTPVAGSDGAFAGPYCGSGGGGGGAGSAVAGAHGGAGGIGSGGGGGGASSDASSSAAGAAGGAGGDGICIVVSFY